MCPVLVERQAETERLTYYPEATHKEFLDAGFYRILVPKRYGGYEFDLTTFWRVIIALARGCPSSAWCFGLAARHALMAGPLFEDDVQQELFGDGNFVCAAVAAPAGVATRTPEGWELTSTHPYASGAPYPTHFMGQTFDSNPDDGPPSTVLRFPGFSGMSRIVYSQPLAPKARRAVRCSSMGSQSVGLLTAPPSTEPWSRRSGLP